MGNAIRNAIKTPDNSHLGCILKMGFQAKKIKGKINFTLQ
jgi:hypothetical protein